MTECSIPCETTDTFFQSLSEKIKATGKRWAFAGSIELTPHCNLKCVHCYITHCKWEGRLLSCSEFCRIIDEAVEEGCTLLLFTGGEPLLREDFLDIYAHAKKKGILITVFTNGTLITPEIARYFHDYTPTLVEISIYGATQATHERVTGVPGSFARCLRGVELLLEQGIRLNLKSMLMTLNKHEYFEMKKLAKSYNVSFRFDPILNPRLDGSRQPLEFRLTPEEILKFDVDDPERYKGWIESYEGLSKLPPPREDTLFTCGGGWHHFYINAFGRLQTCFLACQYGYDLRQGTFHEAWRDFLPSVMSKKSEKPSPCRVCQYYNTCSMCPGWAYLEYGTLEEQPIEYLCQIERLRAKHFAVASKTAVGALDTD